MDLTVQAPNVITKKTQGDRANLCGAPKIWNSPLYYVYENNANKLTHFSSAFH